MPDSTSNHIKVAIVGLGRLGLRHAQMLQQTAGCELIAACSPVASERAAAKQLGIPQVLENYAEVLTNPAVDAVVLVTPTALHAQQTIAALEAGKHVLVEKPLALNLEDCLAVEAATAKRPDLVCAVGFVRRFDAHYRKAHHRLQSGAMGEAFMVRSQTGDKNDESGFFVQFSPSSGGLFMDCSIHDIDLARWFLGNPKAISVYATGSAVLHKGLEQFQDIDNGSAIIEFEGGKSAVLYASRTMAHGHQTHTEVIATRGAVNIGVHAESAQLEFYEAAGKFRPVVQDFYERFEAAFAAELNAFIQACRGIAPMPLVVNDATEATRIGLAITQSLRQKEKVLVV